MKGKIYLILTLPISSKNIHNHLELQKKIVNFLKENLTEKFNIIFTGKHLIEDGIKHIDLNNDVVLWHPLVASNNLSVIKKYKYSIIILKHKTVLIQKVSDNNPVNENMAVNHNFKLLYMEENDDITNEDYEVLGSKEDYIITIDKIKQIINK